MADTQNTEDTSIEALEAKLRRLRPVERELIYALVFAAAVDDTTLDTFEQWWADRTGRSPSGVMSAPDDLLIECTEWLQEISR